MTETIFQEHSPLYSLLSQIPIRICGQNFFLPGSSQDLGLTCVAAHDRFLALGTDCGLVYWFDRKKRVLHRLWSRHDRKSAISAVKLVETVDFMLAAGNALGHLNIFQIAITCGENDDEGKKTEVFAIKGVHKAKISALEWSANGMKLFSGDEAGNVAVTEIDFPSKSTSSRILWKEDAGKIVQLSYGKNQNLLISTARKTVLFKFAQEISMFEIGSRPRKVENDFGAVFVKKSSSDFLAVRPKNALYKCSLEDNGKVQSTILMSTILNRPHLDIPLVNPVIFRTQEDGEEEMQKLIPIMDSDSAAFVAFNKTTLHLLKPFKPEIIASCSGLRGILDLTSSSSSGSTSLKDSDKEEIFILEGRRSLIRIAKYPDPFEATGDEILELDPQGSDVPEGSSGWDNILSAGSSIISDSIISAKIPYISFSSSSEGVEYENGQEALAVEKVLNFASIPVSDKGDEEEDLVFETSSKSSKLEIDLEDEEQEISSLRLELCGDENEKNVESKGLFETLKLDKFLPKKKTDSEDSKKDTKSESTVLSYGPPSDGSFQKPSDSKVDEVEAEKEVFEGADRAEPVDVVSAEDVGENWIKFRTPSKVRSVSSTALSRVCMTDMDKHIFEGDLLTSSLEMSWRKFDRCINADFVAKSPNGKIFWLTHNGKAFAKNSNGTFSEFAEGVKRIVVWNTFGLVLTENGSVKVHKSISSTKPFSAEAVTLQCENSISSIACTDKFILAIDDQGRLLSRLGISESDQPWIELKSLTSKIAIEVDIVAHKSGMIMVVVVLENNRIIYGQGDAESLIFNEGLPWSELTLPSCLMVHSKLLTKFSEEHLWITQAESDYLICNVSEVTASRWAPVEMAYPKDQRLKHVIAGGLYGHEGVLWTTFFSSLRPGCFELAFSKFHDGKFHRVKLPESGVMSLAAGPEALWILTVTSEVYMRRGIRDECLEGRGWRKLDLSQLKGTKLKNISLGSDVVWAVDENGSVLMRLGPLNPEKTADSLPVWIPVEKSLLSEEEKIKFAKVASSASVHIVWAIDEGGQIYVRTGIFPDFRLGLDWISVEQPEQKSVASLSASDDAVWVLTADGAIYRRQGISSSNFIGDRWLKTPSTSIFTALSVSTCDSAFALINAGSGVVELQREEISLQTAKIKGAHKRMTPNSIAEEDGWALVE